MSTLSWSGVEKKVRLKCSDGEILEVEKTLARESNTIKKKMDEASSADEVIELEKVRSEVLLNIMDYCRKHVEAKNDDELQQLPDLRSSQSEDELKEWDAKFVDVEKDKLFELINAAKFLDIKDLLDLATQTCADKMKGKSPEELRSFLNLGPISPEEIPE